MDFDPEVHRFIYGDSPPERREHRARLRARIASGWPPEGGIWVVEWQNAPGFLGWCGLFPLEGAGPIEIGYRYVRSAWGQGVATELGPVDFAAIARACGARGAVVERDDEFEPALRQALVAERPSVIQVVLDQSWISVGDRPER